MPATLLADRAVLAVDGADAAKYLQGLVTCDVERLTPGQAAFGALLTPQGKILFDFFAVRRPDAADGLRAFYLDTPRELAPDLQKRLTMYRLRAKVTIEAANLCVAAVWDEPAPPDGLAFADPRAAEMGFRVIGGHVSAEASSAYEARRIACGLPRGGADFAYGDAFPHEANMDLINGVSFTKGCYVGQEVVSRTQHRGTARRRIVKAAFAGEPPAPGAEIVADKIALGTMGSGMKGAGLASVRIDRLADARSVGSQPMAAGVPLDFVTPEALGAEAAQ